MAGKENGLGRVTHFLYLRQQLDTSEPSNDLYGASCYLYAENPTLGVTCWSATPASPCACVLRAARAWNHVLGREPSPPGRFRHGRRGGGVAPGALGSSGEEKARVGFGSATRYVA